MEQLDIQGPSLDNEDEMVFVNDVTKEGLNHLLCLVDMFLTKKTIQVNIMKERMMDVWNQVEGITTNKASKGIFTFQFYHHRDM